MPLSRNVASSAPTSPPTGPYSARAQRGLPTHQLVDELNGRYHLTRNDIVPFLVLLALETGLEIECCKALMVDCLQNASNGTVEITYLKRRARGAEHKRLRVRDGGPTTPGGMIRRLIEVTARARRHHPSQCLWVYCGAGAFAAGIRHPQEPSIRGRGDTTSSMMMGVRSGCSCPASAKPTGLSGT